MFIMQFWGDKFYIGQAKILARISRKYKISVGKDQVDFEVVVFIIGFFLCNFECQICGLRGGRGQGYDMRKKGENNRVNEGYQ